MTGSAVSSPPSSAGARMQRRFPIAAGYFVNEQTHMRVWAPAAESVTGGVQSAAGTPRHTEGGGYCSGVVEAGAGARYSFRLDDGNQLLPDPASRFQPDGPHGVSEIIDPRAFAW